MEDTKQDHALTNGNGVNGHNGNNNNGNNNNSCDDSDTESEAEEAEPVSATLVLRVVSEPPSPAASRKSSYRCGLELATKLRNVFTMKTPDCDCLPAAGPATSRPPSSRTRTAAAPSSSSRCRCRGQHPPALYQVGGSRMLFYLYLMSVYRFWFLTRIAFCLIHQKGRSYNQ